jgi:hypothetical protein
MSLFFKKLSGDIITIPYRDNLDWNDILLTLSEICNCEKRSIVIFNITDIDKRKEPPIILNNIYNLFIRDIKDVINSSVSVIEIDNIYYINIYNTSYDLNLNINIDDIDNIYDIDVPWYDKKDIIYRITERISVINFEKDLS